MHNSENDFRIIQEIFHILNISITNMSELSGIELDAEVLRNPQIIKQLNNLKPDLKKKYKSSKLTSLHQNNLEKQKFPAVNLIRQVLKCNNYKLHPVVYSNGYCKQTGQKLTKRKYNIIKMIWELKSFWGLNKN